MQPDQNQGHHPDYDFIMSSGARSGKKGLFSGGDKKQSLLIKIIAGGLIFIVVGMIISTFIGGGGSNADRLLSLAQQQTELARVAALGEEELTDAEAKNLGVTVKLSMSSARQQVLEVLGRTPKPDELALQKDGSTDEALTAAKQANRYDETFVSTLQSQLTTYQQELSNFFNESSSQTEKDLLRKLYAEAKVLTNTTE